MLNGVHAYGRRWAPYGNFNYPEEIEKIRQMTVCETGRSGRLPGASRPSRRSMIPAAAPCRRLRQTMW
jgi:hypothetical protein